MPIAGIFAARANARSASRPAGWATQTYEESNLEAIPMQGAQNAVTRPQFAPMAPAQPGKLVALADATLSGDETIATPYGEVRLEHSYITDGSSRRLFDAMDLQRATQAYIWSTPLVSFTTWREQQNQVYGPNARGTFAVFKNFNEKLGIVTANLTTPYIIGFDNLEKGPLSIHYPAGKTAGGVLDFWQRPIADLGLTGPDRGKGGEYIIVGPRHDLAKYKKAGVHAFQSATNNIFLGLRILEKDPGFDDKFKSQLKVAALGGTPATIVFIEGRDKPWSATAPRGIAYWKTLHAIINEEPVREQDKPWMAMLEPLGILRGRPFSPDSRQTRILNEGAALGELMARNLQINPRYTRPYWPGTQWYKSFDFSIPQETANKIELDERATWFYEAVASSEGMVNPRVGAGQVYMTTKRDSKGNLLRADQTYRLHLPADVPVGQFWALTLYSENTRRPYDNGEGTLRSANLDSTLKDLKRNPDGSVDLYIGLKPPDGFENNFMKTVGNDGWFVYLRLYAPLEPFFDKTFTLHDFEVVE